MEKTPELMEDRRTRLLTESVALIPKLAANKLRELAAADPNLLMVTFAEHLPVPPTPAAIWAKVEQSLLDPKYNLRSYRGIAKEHGLAVGDVKAEVARHKDKIRFAKIDDRPGERLFTLASRPKNWREYLSELRYAFVAPVS